ncbi:hypothetical protein [Aliiroseovarius sp. 2305UL8-7]
MTDLFKGPKMATTNIPSPTQSLMPILPGLKSLAAWIEACLEGDRT